MRSQVRRILRSQTRRTTGTLRSEMSRGFASGSSVSELSIFVGCYNEDMYYTSVDYHAGRGEGLLGLTLDAHTGKLSKTGGPYPSRNPTFLSKHPSGKFIYCTNELGISEEGRVTAWEVLDEKGTLRKLNSQPVVSNYFAPPSLTVVPIEDSGALKPRSYLASHDMSQLRADGQVRNIPRNDHDRIEHVRLSDGAHAHSAYTCPHDHSRILAPDLGLDLVLQYSLDSEKGTLAPLPAQPFVTTDARHIMSRRSSGTQQRYQQQHRAGTAMGPRHLCFHPHLPLAFVANELDSSVTTLLLHGQTHSSVASSRFVTCPLGTVDSLPPDFERLPPHEWSAMGGPSPTETKVSHCAEIHASPCGRFVFVSNRGHDSITVLRVNFDDVDMLAGRSSGEKIFLDELSGGGEPLVAVGHFATGGSIPRSFALDPSGRIAVVANQEADRVETFWIDQETGALEKTGHGADIGSPTCVLVL